MRQRRILAGRIPGAAEESVPAARDALAAELAAGFAAGLRCSRLRAAGAGRTRRSSHSAGLCLLG